MPAQHVAKAAAVLIAASTIAMPTASVLTDGPVGTSFVEVLMGPDTADEHGIVALASNNNGCHEP